MITLSAANRKSIVLLFLIIVGVFAIKYSSDDVTKRASEPKESDRGLINPSTIEPNRKGEAGNPSRKDYVLFNDDGTLVLPKAKHNFRLFDSKFILSRQALDNAGISEKDAIEIQTFLSTLRNSFTAEIKSRIKSDPLRSNLEENEFAYFIPSYPSVGANIVRQFYSDVTGVVGMRGAEKLLESFWWESTFASLGNKEVYATFKEDTSGLMLARWEIRDTLTGKIFRATESRFPAFEAEFGKVLEIEVAN